MEANLDRQRARHGHLQGAAPSSFHELSGLSFSLGAAGQQYLADTPWANPQHPLHRVHRQQEPVDGSLAGGLLAPRVNADLAAMSGQATGGEGDLVKSQSTGALESGHQPLRTAYGVLPKTETLTQSS